MPDKKMSVKGDFGRLLKSLRIRSGTAWTQESLAEELRDSGCKASLRTYKGWESGESIPPPEVLKHIVALLGLNREDEDALYRAAAQVPPITDPIVNNLPFRKNPFFIGRETELEQLRELLQGTGAATITQPVSISGMGGVGKTELALEYAHRSYPTVYRAVFWVNAADETTLQADYGGLAELLKLPERNEQEQTRHIQAVKEWLEEHTDWLLVMDNADDLPLADSFLPAKPLGHVLFTTRSQLVADSDIVAQIKVEEMKLEEALAFLLWRSDRVQDEAALEVVESLGGLPLALDQSGAYIRGTGISFADYLKRYREQRRLLLNKRRPLENESSKDSTHMRHPESVVVTFELIFQVVRQRYPLAADILSFCSLLQPDAIPEELFQHDESFAPDTIEFDEAIAALQQYSLIKRNTQEQTCSLHRLVQAVLIDGMPPDLLKQWRGRVLLALNIAFPVVKLANWRQYERLLPHALFCATWQENKLPPGDILSVVRVCVYTGYYLRDRGRYSEAETLMARVLSFYEQDQDYGAAHPDTASVHRDLGDIYARQGKHEEAEPHLVKALAIHESQLGAEHDRTVHSLENLAIHYLRQRKYEQAEPLLEKSLAIQSKKLGAEHPKTIRYRRLLSLAYTEQGKYEESEHLVQLTLTIHKGTNLPEEAAHELIDLAFLYLKQGKHAEFEHICQRLIAIQEKLLDAEDPVFATLLYGLVIFLHVQHKHEQADLLYRRIISILDRQMDAEHPVVLRIKRDYANFLHEIGLDSLAAALDENDEPTV